MQIRVPFSFVRSRTKGRARLTSICAVAAIALAPSGFEVAKAQQAAPSGFDSRETERRFDATQSGQSRAEQPGLQLPRISRPALAAGTGSGFRLNSIALTGAHAIPRDQIAMVYQPYLGKTVSPADLAAITCVISDHYRAAGFHLSRAIVPAQDIKDGKVRIQVIEGSIVELVLHGDEAGRFGARRLLDPVVAETPSRLSTLERQLLLLNGQPGVRIIDTSLEEIGVGTGRFRLTVDVKSWHIYTAFGVDNLGSSSVGPWQTYATAAFNSYLTAGDTLSVNLSTTPGDPRELAFGRLSYDTPLGIDGVRIGGSALYSEVRPGDDRRLFNDVTKTDAFELRGSYVPLFSQRSTLTLIAAAGFSDVTESDVFGSIYKDHIRTVSLTSDYQLKDNFGGSNDFTLTWRQDLDILGASRKGDDFLSRTGASANSSTMDVWFTRYQTLSDTWSLKLAAASQIASGPLFTSQQFYLGGAAFGRGYGSAEISGDNGVAGSVELRFDQRLNLRYVTGYQLYGFVDSGVAWNDGYSYSDGLTLTSVGAGVRFFLLEDLRTDFAIAFPLSYRAPDNSSRSARLLFSISNAFKL